MNQKQLIKALTIVEKVESSSWNRIISVVAALNKQIAWILEQKSEISWKKDTDFDLSNAQVWSTYDGCVDGKFYLIGDFLYGDICIWDGDNFHGLRKNKRFSVKLGFKPTYISELKDSIEYAFNKYLENCYETYLKAKRQLWIDNLKKQLLN